MEKASLIMVIKVINLIVFSFWIQSVSQNLYPDSSIVCLNIQFGDYFKNDKVDLAINDSLVLKKVTLTSSQYYGLTNAWVKVTYKNNHYLITTSESSTANVISLNPGGVKLSVRFRGKYMKFEFNRKYGKYVVFSTNRQGKMIFTQSTHKPVFD